MRHFIRSLLPWYRPGTEPIGGPLISVLAMGIARTCVDAPLVCLQASSFVILRVNDAVSNIPSPKSSYHAQYLYAAIHQCTTMVRMSQKYLAEGTLR